MCGLSGFTFSDCSNEQAGTMLAKMLRKIVHRGPDSQGIYCRNNIALGHQRLAIIDPEGGQQPCQDDYGNVLVFNGEIYAYQKFYRHLEEHQIIPANHSDSEVLFALLKIYGIENTLSMIDGMFAFAFYEARSATLFLARDRFGEKPLYYSQQNGQLIFASEVSAIRQHPGLADCQINLDSVYNYLILEYLIDNQTLYQSIHTLPPGCWLSYKQSEIRIEQYWQAPVASLPGDEDQNQDKVKQLQVLLEQSVQQCLVADVPVGVFLSGGIDSSLIAAVAKRHSDNIKSYTIKMPQASFDESHYAESIARKLGLQHTTIPVTDTDILNSFEILSEKLDEPLADSSLLPSLLLCQMTRRHVKVALGGDGADELFAGYPNFQVQAFAGLMARFPQQSGSLLRKLLAFLPYSHNYMNLAFKLRQLSYGFGQSSAMQSFHWMSAISLDEQQKLWNKDYQSQIGVHLNQTIQQVATSIRPGMMLENEIEQLLALFVQTYLPGDILKKMDRASMYNSLEVRSPFLGKDLSKFALSLPVMDKTSFRKSKIILKQLAQEYLPTEFIHRKKHGFGFPISMYLRALFKEQVADVILDKTNPAMAYFNHQCIVDYWQQHQKRQRDHGKKIWVLYILMNLLKKG